MSTPLILLSYSHQDEAIKNRMVTHLRVLERSGQIKIFDTSRIFPDEKLNEQIHEAIERANVALLFVSPYFLASDLITKLELPRLLERQERGEMVVIPVIVSPALWTQIPGLRRLQAWPRDARPITDLDDVHLENELAELAARISDLVDAISKQPIHTSLLPQTDEKSISKKNMTGKKDGQFFISHAREDGDFAELLKLKLEKEGLTAWIDIERLSVGEDWRQEIDAAIQNTKALVVVVTPAARQSDYVTYEWAFAWGAGVPVIPILLKETPMHPRLESLQYLDFTNHIARPWKKLLEALRSASAKRHKL